MRKPTQLMGGLSVLHGLSEVVERIIRVGWWRFTALTLVTLPWFFLATRPGLILFDLVTLPSATWFRFLLLVIITRFTFLGPIVHFLIVIAFFAALPGCVVFIVTIITPTALPGSVVIVVIVIIIEVIDRFLLPSPRPNWLDKGSHQSADGH